MFSRRVQIIQMQSMSEATVIQNTPAATPAPTVAADVAAPIPLAGNGCYWKNCTQAHQNGEGNIPQGSDHYCSKQDRDGDGLACEYYN